MNYKNSFLSKLANKISKVAEAKEHFDNKKKEEEDSYVKKVMILKEVLTQEYKFVSKNKTLHNSYAMKVEVIEKHINFLRKIQNNKTFDLSDKQIIDVLIKKYCQ